MEYLEEIDLGPGSGEGVVVETVVESSLNYLDQYVCKRLVHVTVLIWLLLGDQQTVSDS